MIAAIRGYAVTLSQATDAATVWLAEHAGSCRREGATLSGRQCAYKVLEVAPTLAAAH